MHPLFSSFDLSHVVLTIFFSASIAYLSYLLKFLTISGSIATFLLALVVFGLGGWQWTLPMLAFFVLSSLLSAFGKDQKRQFEKNFEKSGTRDWGQVLANGGLAGAVMIVQCAVPDSNLYPIYAGSIAAVTADTWGTEIGILFHQKTISIVRLTSVEPGTNGGVSFAGSLGSLLGATIIALISSYWMSDFRPVIITAAAGMMGSLADSIFGETIQARYKCRICRRITEKRRHCGNPADLSSGIHFITNNVVNGLCAFIGIIIVYIFA